MNEENREQMENAAANAEAALEQGAAAEQTAETSGTPAVPVSAEPAATAAAEPAEEPAPAVEPAASIPAAAPVAASAPAVEPAASVPAAAPVAAPAPAVEPAEPVSSAVPAAIPAAQAVPPVRQKDGRLVSAVAYLHDDCALVKPFLERVCGALSERFERFEVILVNDDSRDGGVEAVREFVRGSACETAVTVVNMSMAQGMERCMNAGVDLAKGEYVFEFDTLDLPRDSTLIGTAFDTVQSGFDIVSVSPQKGHGGFGGTFYRVFNRFSRTRSTIEEDIFRVLSRRAIEQVRAVCAMPPYRKAAYAASGLRMVTLRVPVTGRRVSGKKGRVNLSLAIDSLMLYTDAVYKLSCGVAMLMLVGALAQLVYMLFTGGGTAAMLLITVGFFGVFLILATMLKYLSLIVDPVSNKKKYLIESVEHIRK